MDDPHQDEQKDCVACGAPFVLTAAEAAAYAERGQPAPKRCPACRQARKEQRAQGGERGERGEGAGSGQGGPRGPRGPHGQRAESGQRADARPRGPRQDRPQARGAQPHARDARGTGNPNEYRSPMGGGRMDDRGPRVTGRTGDPNEYRSPMDAGRAGEGYRGPSAGNTGDPNGYRSPSAGNTGDPNGYRSPMGAGRTGADEYRRPMTGARKGGAGEYRSPMRTGMSGDARPHAGGGRRPPRQGAADKPMFPITCTACGKPAQVPFKPVAGRDVLCPECHRARKTA